MRYYASEEQDDVVELNPAGRYRAGDRPARRVVEHRRQRLDRHDLLDLRGQGRRPDGSFLRPGRRAASPAATSSTGRRPTSSSPSATACRATSSTPTANAWRLVETAHKVPATASEFAINASNYRHWRRRDPRLYRRLPRRRDRPARQATSTCAGSPRWWPRPTGSCRAAASFSTPATSRPGYERGRLRLVYECAPIAFLIEQAGGEATDGTTAILTCRPRRAARAHAVRLRLGREGRPGRAPTRTCRRARSLALFGNRGLFRG